MWPHTSETKALSKNSPQVSHLNPSQQGFGWFVTELQGIWPKILKLHVLAPTGRIGQSPAKDSAIALMRAESHFLLTTNLQECYRYVFHLTVKASGLGEASRMLAVGTPTQASPDSWYQLERGVEVTSLETCSRLRPAGIPWLNLSHPPNKNSMFHQQNASSPIRSIFSK